MVAAMRMRVAAHQGQMQLVLVLVLVLMLVDGHERRDDVPSQRASHLGHPGSWWAGSHECARSAFPLRMCLAMVMQPRQLPSPCRFSAPRSAFDKCAGLR